MATPTSPQFIVGQLVEATTAGVQGQLLDWDGDSWQLLTFDGKNLAVKEAEIRALALSDVTSFDLALGPASDPSILSQTMVALLQEKGHFVCKAFVPASDLGAMVDAAKDADARGLFKRLPVELEEGYLGRDGLAKTLLLNVEAAPAPALSSDSIRQAENVLSSIGRYLQPYLGLEFGTSIIQRSDLLLTLPFDDDEEDSYAVPELQNQVAADFVNMMWRTNLQCILNIGPEEAKLRLLPKSEANVDTTLKLPPGYLAVFRPSCFKFYYRHGGLGISTWFMDTPTEYVLSDDMDLQELKPMLTGSGGGPQGFPRGGVDNACVQSMAVRAGGNQNTPERLFLGYAFAGYDGGLEFPRDRWELDLYYAPNADSLSGKSYTKHGGFSEGIHLFDNKFFDISLSEARGMDPTQRQVLEVSYMALSEGGFQKKQLQSKSSNIGVWVGLDKNEWNGLPKDVGDGGGSTGSANAITSNRFSYIMNLKGASMTVDTACSSSLVAIHTAKLYLFYKHYDPCEAVVVTGVNLSISPWTYVGGCAAGMHSHIGRCFTYNSSADGYMRGESTQSTLFHARPYDPDDGSLVLIAGSQVNQDGRSATLTAPNGPAQERCNRATLKEGRIDPQEIDCTECHGTGTSLGDPIEVGAYRRVMSKVDRNEPVIATSCKSNLGHCEGSAGISGFLKCVLMCLTSHGCSNVHLRAMNPHLDVSGFPCIFLTESVVLRANASLNGVLSFGFGGTNACAQLWGEDLLTSRGSYAKSSDLSKLLLDKVNRAPAPEVTITGPNWEDWQMEGPGRRAAPGETWGLRLDEDGVVSFERRQQRAAEDEKNAMGEYTYFISGTFNNWSCEQLEPDDLLAGLHVGGITLGESGEEQFQVVANENQSLCFAPVEDSCTQRSCSISGPKATPHEKAWCIKGSAGDRYRVEWYVSESNACSVNWLKQ